MAFKSIMDVEGTPYNVLSCSYHFYQETDVTGRPSSIARGGQITVTVESSDDISLVEWMIDSWGLKKGNIKFFKRDSETAIMKQVDFEDAYLVNYAETYSHQSEMPMVITITISAKKLSVGNASHENAWIK